MRLQHDCIEYSASQIAINLSTHIVDMRVAPARRSCRAARDQRPVIALPARRPPSRPPGNRIAWRPTVATPGRGGYERAEAGDSHLGGGINMSRFVIEPPPQASVAVAGNSGRFPVRRIICVGRNYAEHAREMGSDPDREPPFFFMKPADAVTDGGAIPYPPLTASLHYEVELVVAIGAPGDHVTPGDGLALAYGYGVGVDLTRRDLQNAAKSAGRPWEWGKAFDFSAPCGPLSPVSAGGRAAPDARLSLTVNGQLRQTGVISDMIWSVPEIIANVSGAMRLAPGDLIFTGTPAGVGPLSPGDVVAARIDGLPPLDFSIAPRA